MRKIAKICCALLAVLFLLPGCSQKSHSKPLVLVTKVTVTSQKNGDILQWYYTDPEKIEAVMHYLLRLKPYGFAERDPELVCGPFFEIKVALSNGKSHIYRQRADRYISKDCQTWELIDPKRAAMLYPLLEQMESDLS